MNEDSPDKVGDDKEDGLQDEQADKPMIELDPINIQDKPDIKEIKFLLTRDRRTSD